MVHVFAHLVFAVGILRWLTWEFKRPFRPERHWGWLVVVSLMSVTASMLAFIDGGRLGNILLHAIGGGMATACTYEYLKAHLRFKLNWRLDLAGLFLIVSAFGVLNELAEFAAEAAGMGIFSVDSQDTWRDFVANTVGAVIVWLYVRLLLVSKTK